MSTLADFATVPLTDTRSPHSSVLLQDLWKDGPCALFFLRRLGCPLCRSYIKMIEEIRYSYTRKGVNMVCLSFEAPGEGSDTDRSFQAGGYWNGPLYVIDKAVYAKLFSRKGLMNSFFGLLDMDKEALQRSKGTPGNFKGDGFQLGGQFIVAQGGTVVFEHRQKAFGDDAKLSEIIAVLDEMI